MLQGKSEHTCYVHYVVLSSIIFSFENRALYEIMWKNIVEWGGPQVAIWRMRVACWIPKATDTLRIL